MTSPFKSRKHDCNAKDILDALTILHDLGIWDEYIIEYGANDPQGLIDRVRNDQDNLIKECEERINANARILVWRTYYPLDKIPAIKYFRDEIKSGLAQAKTFVESLPLPLPLIFPSLEAARECRFVKNFFDKCRAAAHQRGVIDDCFEFLHIPPDWVVPDGFDALRDKFIRRYDLDTVTKNRRLE